MMEPLLLALATIVLFKVISVMASINAAAFDGHPIQFIGMAMHWSLVGSGAVAVALGLSIGGAMLLAGIALMVVTDRRCAMVKHIYQVSAPDLGKRAKAWLMKALGMEWWSK